MVNYKLFHEFMSKTVMILLEQLQTMAPEGNQKEQRTEIISPDNLIESNSEEKDKYTVQEQVDKVTIRKNT